MSNRLLSENVVVPALVIDPPPGFRGVQVSADPDQRAETARCLTDALDRASGRELSSTVAASVSATVDHLAELGVRLVGRHPLPDGDEFAMVTTVLATRPVPVPHHQDRYADNGLAGLARYLADRMMDTVVGVQRLPLGPAVVTVHVPPPGRRGVTADAGIEVRFVVPLPGNQAVAVLMVGAQRNADPDRVARAAGRIAASLRIAQPAVNGGHTALTLSR